MTTFVTVSLKLLEGFGTTFLIFLITLLLAFRLAPIALCSMSRFKPLRWLSRAFVWAIRGTPLMHQVIIVFYGPDLIGMPTSLSRMNALGGRRVRHQLPARIFQKSTRRNRERTKASLKPGSAGSAQGSDFLQDYPAAGDQADHSANEQRNHHAGQGYVACAHHRRARADYGGIHVHQNAGAALALVLIRAFY
jgi:His/Glu/Gln/Arg/opine family amino acid ABC transporter permease subunit